MKNYFQIYYPFKSKGAWRPGVYAHALSRDVFKVVTQAKDTYKVIKSYRNGDGIKTALPAVCWSGFSSTRYRKAENMTPTGFFMLDYDHVTLDIKKLWEDNASRISEYNILIAHITPSGKGLRIVARCKDNLHTLAENMDWLHNELSLGIGDYDPAVKDISRLSFCPQSTDILYINNELWTSFEDGKLQAPMLHDNPRKDTTPCAMSEQPKKDVGDSHLDKQSISTPLQNAKEYRYRGHLVTDIIAKYVEIYGQPQEGERHNFYNQMIKYFRNITDNNPQLLCQLLPRFDPDSTDESCLSQCQSICRTNTTGKLPREFFLFLLKNGFYKQAKEEEIKDSDLVTIMSTKESKELKVPPLPPIFKQIVGTCPSDFVVPCINALLPVMGTITSNVRAIYPYDARQHSTEFFSIIYAPPGTGKGFIERFISILHRNIELRDLLSDRKESIYAAAQLRKSDNEHAPENPRVSKRIMEAKNSETDFLEKQQANKGHHMFTYAAEMDQWRKGVRAAGGNKDDMIRIAWDNGYYGQSFKSANSFKGRVKLFWNVLISGTRDQLDAYFKNVTNGLVTRCGFASIDNQEFALAPRWGCLTKKDMSVINAWIDKQDKAEYQRELDFDFDTLDEITDENFDKEVPWKHAFREPHLVDIDWIMPTIEKWLDVQREQALLNQNLARDVFRRRVAVRGFRLALLCTTLYDSIGKAEQKTIKNFVNWWMGIDIESILSLYGAKYNELSKDETKTSSQQGLWDSLPDSFSLDDLRAACLKCDVLTPPRNIIYVWKRQGLIKYNKKDKTIVKTKK